MSLLTVYLANPTGYGRIVRTEGQVVGIIEQKDAKPEQLLIHEANTGIFFAKGVDLKRWLSGLPNDNAQGKYYLTDIIAAAHNEGKVIATAHPETEIEGANSRLAEELMIAGASLRDPARIDINCIFEGSVTIANNVKIGANCILKNCSISAKRLGEVKELAQALQEIPLSGLSEVNDNTDFPVNPDQSSSQYLSLTYNPKWLESNDNWTLIDFEASKYFSFGANDFAKQNILALNMWASYSPSWNVTYDEQGNSLVNDNAPFLEGATLGGMNRLRGFRQNRYYDKAAIYATAEYRMTLDYNPVANVSWLRFLNLDWFQTVFYVEGGRVAPTFTSKDLFSNWKQI